MVRPNRPSAVDLWPDRPAYLTGSDDVMEIDGPSVAAPPVFPRGPIIREEDTDSEDDSEDDSLQRPSRNKGLNPTCVTPLIATLAQDLYPELVVAGPFRTRGVDLIKRHSLVASDQYIEFMDRLLELVHALPFNPVFDERYKLNRRNYRNHYTYYSAVEINSLLFRINDIIIVPAGKDDKSPVPDFPESAPRTRPYAFAGDLFWFGRILSIRRETSTAHVQWLQHASKTILQELAHPQELFMTDQCSNVRLETFLARCQCRKLTPDQRQELNTIVHMEFFYSFSYDEKDAVFRDMSEVEENPNDFAERHGTCKLCAIREEESRRNNEDCVRLADGGEVIGFERRGVAYHCDDVVLVNHGDSGPCVIGKITEIVEESEEFALRIKIFGRMSDLLRRVDGMIAGEYEDRHLFLTDQTMKISSDMLLGKAFVLHERATEKSFRLRGWLEASPNHFYVTKKAPSMEVACQGEIVPLSMQDFVFCEMCIEDEIDETYDFLVWKEDAKAHPLRIFDPFAGCGAFVLGACETGTMKFTHAIDISSSATATTRKNSPGTVVYNQCSNKMLEFAVSRMNGTNMTLTDLLTDEELPAPPRRGESDCIVSGFPCQPHSTLNMFQRAYDPLNELFLNTVSWVEHLQPKYCLFENVAGFLSHRIGATQKDHYTVQGGIEQGGVKFVCVALIALGYQVRLSMLQAAHYGAPQTRERFFLFAARAGLPLPKFPPRTHDFPNTKFLGIKFTNGDVISPIPTNTGIAPLPHVNVAEAISDLKRWDWVNPHKVYKRTAQYRQEEEERSHIEQVRSHYGDKFCGIGGAEYEHGPRSAFQAKCRRRPAEELQHVTPCFSDDIVERTCNIPVEIGANYKNLNNRPLLWDYQMMDPSSANARRGYGDTMYGRLKPEGYFSTIVTHVKPTAKQCNVLNPWCKRMVTVRELARSQGIPDDFTFEAVDHKVKKMHRLIGNAVPWPMSEALGRELEKAWYKESKKNAMEKDEVMEC